MGQVTSNDFTTDKITAWFESKKEGDQTVGYRCSHGNCPIQQYIYDTMKPDHASVGFSTAEIRDAARGPIYRVDLPNVVANFIDFFDGYVINHYVDRRPLTYSEVEPLWRKAIKANEDAEEQIKEYLSTRKEEDNEPVGEQSS